MCYQECLILLYSKRSWQFTGQSSRQRNSAWASNGLTATGGCWWGQRWWWHSFKWRFRWRWCASQKTEIHQRELTRNLFCKGSKSWNCIIFVDVFLDCIKFCPKLTDWLSCIDLCQALIWVRVLEQGTTHRQTDSSYVRRICQIEVCLDFISIKT